MKYFLIVLLFIVTSCSCQKEEPIIYMGNEILDLVKIGDPKVIIKLPSKETEVIRCDTYLPPCKTSHLYIIKELEVIFLEYNTQDEAIKAAKAINGYYLRNWVIDDVVGEPILERFVEEYLKATRPN
jgi:hypothetical protein